eukprot:12763402-Alexandrium_andersonii.AAC.1
MSASLVGSEMCIRDSPGVATVQVCMTGERTSGSPSPRCHATRASRRGSCLLYTSDAADDM